MSDVVEKMRTGSVDVRQEEEEVFPRTYPALQEQEKEPGVL